MRVYAGKTRGDDPAAEPAGGVDPSIGCSLECTGSALRGVREGERGGRGAFGSVYGSCVLFVIALPDVSTGARYPSPCLADVG